MAAYIFPDFDTFKSHVGGAVSQSMLLETITPAILDAAEQHIIPWLGQTMWDFLVAGVAADNLTSPHTTLLPYVQRALARLTLFEYSKEGSVQFSEVGLMRQESDSEGVVKGAWKYQENQYREHQRDRGFEALEKMLIHLEANSGDYSKWTSDTASNRNREYYINTAILFRTIYSLKISRYVFEVMRPVMNEVELFAIMPNLGEDFHDELKAAILAKTTSAAQNSAIAFIQRAVVHFTVRESIRREIVQHTGDAIVLKEKLEPQSYVREGSPSNDKLSLQLRQNDEFGNRYISSLLRMLDANLDDYPTYKAYKEELAAAEEEATTIDDECTLRCGCGCGGYEYNCISKTTRKSIIRL